MSAPHSLQDVIETNVAFKIKVDTPGMGADDLNIELQEGVLTISGKKKAETEEKDRVRTPQAHILCTSMYRLDACWC